MKEVKRKLKLFLFNSRLFSKLTGRNHILVIGDSHVHVFKHVKKDKLLSRLFFIDYKSVGGATAQGVLNPGSKTDARRLFMQRVSEAKKFQHLIVQLGEVDCGFVIWYYAEKYGGSVEDQLARSIKNYSAFLEELSRFGFASITVMSAPLPTIQDGQDWGEIAKKRAEVTAKQIPRTNLTIKFNRKMFEVCLQNGYKYINHVPSMLDKTTQVVKQSFLNEDKNDHHLKDTEYALLIKRSLLSIFNQEQHTRG